MRLLRLAGSGITKEACQTLYELLSERDDTINISHREMPSYASHVAFVKSQPYMAWYLMQVDGEIVGSIYLSKQREVGLFVFRKHEGKGYGKEALAMLQKYWPGKLLANVNPKNERSIEFFKGQGFKLIQATYALR